MTDNPHSSASRTDDTIKETFESIVVAFILAFVFRAYVVEAFVIPTGSMAPTLLGEHLRLRCEKCGYSFDADADDKDRAETVTLGDGRKASYKRDYLTRALRSVCPMCGQAVEVPRGTRVSAGDRILVHKYIYSVAEPRRWDVVVFKNPQEFNLQPDGTRTPGPTTNFIKRLVGLPGEKLLIVEGNVYTQSVAPAVNGNEQRWQIQRKAVRPEVQRAVWQPIYHSQYVPLDRDSWRPPWQPPWKPVDDSEGRWNLEDHHGYRWSANQAGIIRFDRNRNRDPRSPRYPYDQLKTAQPAPFEEEPTEDVRIAAAFQPDGPGLSVRISTTARWGIHDGSRWEPAGSAPQVIAAVIDASGRATLEVPDIPDPATGSRPWVLAKSDVGVFAANKTREVELWYVDQEASLWVDGRRVLSSSFELELDTLAQRKPLPNSWMPSVTIRVQGTPVTLHRVELDRDLYYSSNQPPQSGGTQGRGTLAKYGDKALGGPVAIQADEFFCMGDNSPLSHDSRYWENIDPWIEYRMFPRDQGHPGMVPRELMLGRAFFVYWPAARALAPDQRGFIPDFGDMRFIH